MKKTKPSLSLILFSSLSLGVCIAFLGCEISGGDETVREVSLNIAGTYQNDSGIASNQSGSRVTALNLQQSGDRLDGIDNLGLIWSGSIGRADAGASVATVTLTGQTSNGVQVVITGEVRVDNTRGVLSGVWVEPVIRSSVSAEATVAVPPAEVTPTPTPDTTPTPTPIPLSI